MPIRCGRPDFGTIWILSVLYRGSNPSDAWGKTAALRREKRHAERAGKGEPMSRTSITITTACLLAGLWAAGLPAGAQATASEWCGLCHRDIYAMWGESAHARSVESIPFLLSYRETEDRHGRETAGACLDCHAPMRRVTGDTGLDYKVTWEGVNCDACHSIRKVDTSGRTPKHVLDVGPVKRGPIREAVSSGHDVEYSELHTQSLVCAGCHEYTNSEGTKVLATYSEWSGSESAARGKTCQICHMGTTDAEVVDPRVKRVDDPVNIHLVPGGHSLVQLNEALGVSIRPERNEDGMRLVVTVTNKGAGHAVPTGMPGRRIILDLDVNTSSGQDFQAQRTYGRFFEDADGNPIVKDGGYFATGVKEVRDTRFKPDETRVETFDIDCASDDMAHVTLKLHYEHAPMGNEDGRTWLTFYTEKRTIKVDRLDG
jgi:hypothetical protein